MLRFERKQQSSVKQLFFNKKIKKCFPQGGKKKADIALPTKVHLVKATVFLVVTYGCESWTIKKADHRRTDAFELWC